MEVEGGERDAGEGSEGKERKACIKVGSVSEGLKTVTPLGVAGSCFSLSLSLSLVEY